MSDTPQWEVNHDGWFCLQHNDGWMIGDKDGVCCYPTMEIAKAALTLVWQREGGGKLNYRIAIFRKKPIKCSGEHKPKYSAEEALKRYEGRNN